MRGGFNEQQVAFADEIMVPLTRIGLSTKTLILSWFCGSLVVVIGLFLLEPESVVVAGTV